MNLTTFRSSITAELGLDNTAGGDQPLMDQRVNEGVTDYLLETGCKVISATLTETSGQGDYTLDTAILQVKGWYWSSGTDYRRPQRVSVDELLRLRVAAQATTTGSTPAAYYALAGSNLLMVYPTPSAADTITVYYVPRPVVLTTGANTPDEIPAEFHPAVEFYALWRLASYDDDQSSAQGQRYRDEYDRWVSKAKKFITLRDGRGRTFRVPGTFRRAMQTVASQDLG